MALSDGFIEVFSQMVKNYTDSSPILMKKWREDTHFEPISRTLQAILDIILMKKNQNLLSDIKLINSLSNSAIILHNDDPSFFNCYRNFLNACKAQKIIPDSTIDKSINIEPDSEEEPPLELIKSMHITIDSMRRTQEKQKISFEKKLNAKDIEYEKLSAKFEALKSQIRDQAPGEVQNKEEILASLLPFCEKMGFTITLPSPAYSKPVKPWLDESSVLAPDHPPPPPPAPIEPPAELSSSSIEITKNELDYKPEEVAMASNSDSVPPQAPPRPPIAANKSRPLAGPSFINELTAAINKRQTKKKLPESPTLQI